jgi:hypothetical protein
MNEWFRRSRIKCGFVLGVMATGIAFGVMLLQIPPPFSGSTNSLPSVPETSGFR